MLVLVLMHYSCLMSNSKDLPTYLFTSMCCMFDLSANGQDVFICQRRSWHSTKTNTMLTK